MHHVGNAAHQIDGVEQVNGLRAVGHGDGDLVALPDADGIDQIGRIRMKAPDARNRIECRRFQHFPCAQGGLFSWLEEKPHCPTELVLMFLQPDRSPDSRRDVKIVSAGVHLSRTFRRIR